MPPKREAIDMDDQDLDRLTLGEWLERFNCSPEAASVVDVLLSRPVERDAQARGARILADATRYAQMLHELSAEFTAPSASEAETRLREFQGALGSFACWISAQQVLWPYGDETLQ